MKTRRPCLPLGAACFATILCMGGLGQAQTFQIIERSGDQELSLDATHLVTYTVELSGGQALQQVVPSLTTPPCGQISVDGGTANIFNSSYAGYGSEGSWTLGPIPSWPNDTTVEVAFNVHLHDNPAGQSICTDLCGTDLRFGLEFTSATMATPVAAQPSSLLEMTRPSAEGYELTALASELVSPIGLLDIFTMFDWSLATYPLADDPSDPDVRVFVMFDWNVHTQNLGSLFQFMFYSTDDTCGINVHHAFNDHLVQLFAEPLYDATGTLLAGPEGLITQAPLGGAGTQYDPEGTGMNFFDFTDVVPSCGGSLRDHISYAPGTTYYAGFLQMGITPIIIRNIALYLGRPRPCAPSQPVFGPPSAAFGFLSAEADPTGLITAELSVPELWKTGSDLGTDFSIEWYLRGQQAFSPVNDEDSDGVALNLEAATTAADDGERLLEARIHHTNTGSVVSVLSTPFTISRAQDPPGGGAVTPSSDSDSDCGCRLPGHRPRPPGLAPLVALLVLWLRRRRTNRTAPGWLCQR